MTVILQPLDRKHTLLHQMHLILRINLTTELCFQTYRLKVISKTDIECFRVYHMKILIDNMDQL